MANEAVYETTVTRAVGTGQIETPADGVLHILQLTDFHSDASEVLTQQTYQDVRKLVSLSSPDLLAVTGDIWCGDSTPWDAPALMNRDLAFLGSLGVPWAFAWGNHDYVGDLADSLDKIRATPNALAPEGDGNGSFRIEVIENGVGRPLWDLFFLNSGLEWELPKDLEWFEAESARIADQRDTALPAIVYVHIPLIEFEQARQNGSYVGIAREEVLHWGDDGQVFDAFRRAGADRLAKGAKLLKLDTRQATFTSETIFPDGTRWNPDEA
jgi:predicted MPP superfamily phosphohydrolase